MNHDIRSRKPAADRLSEDVAAYLANGGKIERPAKNNDQMARFNAPVRKSTREILP